MTATEPEPEHWYQREPGRLRWELDQFERHGLAATPSYDDEGRLVVATEVRLRGEPLTAIRICRRRSPPTATSSTGIRIRSARTSACSRTPTRTGRPWFSAAQLIGKSLRALLRDFEAGHVTVTAREADMPEPVSAHFYYDPDVVVLVPKEFLIDELPATHGTMRVIRGQRRIALLAEAGGPGRHRQPPRLARTRRQTDYGALGRGR